MRQRGPSSLLSGDANLSLLAREVRARQRLAACATQPAVVPAAVAAATKGSDKGRPWRSDPLSDKPEVAHDLDRGRSGTKEGHKSRRGDKGRRRRRTTTATTGSARRTTESDDNSHAERRAATGIEHTIDPSVELAMLRVFSGDGPRNRGVSVSAIRRLYRKRHEEEKSKALEEVRRWWRVGRSEAAPLAEATVAASLMLASRTEANNTEGIHGLPYDGVGLESGGRPPEDAGATLVCNEGDGGVTPKTNSLSSHQASHENLREYRDQEQHYAVDGLDWHQVARDPLHAAGIVRDIKQALRSGQPVKVCSRQTSPGRSSLVDCQLMLRTLYMQCIQVGSMCQQPSPWTCEGRIQW